IGGIEFDSADGHRAEWLARFPRARSRSAVEVLRDVIHKQAPVEPNELRAGIMSGGRGSLLRALDRGGITIHGHQFHDLTAEKREISVTEGAEACAGERGVDIRNGGSQSGRKESRFVEVPDGEGERSDGLRVGEIFETHSTEEQNAVER